MIKLMNDKLRLIRMSKNIKITEAAKAVQCSSQTITRLENNYATNTNLNLLYKLCRYYQINLSDIIEHDELNTKVNKAIRLWVFFFLLITLFIFLSWYAKASLITITYVLTALSLNRVSNFKNIIHENNIKIYHKKAILLSTLMVLLLFTSLLMFMICEDVMHQNYVRSAMLFLELIVVLGALLQYLIKKRAS